MTSGLISRHHVIWPIALILITAICANGADRPLLKYEGEVESLREAVAEVMARSDADVADAIDPSDRSAKDNAVYLGAIDRLIALHAQTGERPPAERALLILETLSAPALAEKEAQLAARITADGAADPMNPLMRDVAYDLARIHHLRRALGQDDLEVAGKVAAILEAFAEHVPDWPLLTREGELTSQDDEQYLRYWGARGLWGTWYHTDMQAGVPLVRAFDLIHDSGVMQERGTLETIERDAIRHVPEWYLRRPMDLFNMTGNALQGLIQFGKAIPEPRYIHIAVARHRYMLNAKYYADGFWHEGTPAYHKQITSRAAGKIADMLKGYSDPPGYTCEIDLPRYDDLDLAADYARQYERVWQSLEALTFPGPRRDYAKIHEATWPHHAWWDERVDESRPRLLGSMGHAIVGMGTYPQEAELHLGYSGTHNHEHFDNLGIILWAHGREVLSDTRYRAPAGSVTERAWHMATAAHNTVVIDEANQSGRFNGHRRKITERDAMTDVSQYPGMTIDIPNWTHRSNGMGDSHNDGELRLYATDGPGVQVIEASAERSWNPSPEIYRRTVALVQAGEGGYYAVDFFRVRGGETHDWMLHGCLQDTYELATSVELAPREGQLHKYLTDLRAGSGDEAFSASIAYQEGPHTVTHVLGSPGTQVIVGSGPAMRAEGYTDFLDVRREGPQSTFVAVHDVVGEAGPSVQSIEAIDWGGPMDLGVRITLTDGRIDVVVSAGGDPPFEAQQIPGFGEFAGRFAHMRLSDGEVMQAWAADAERLQAGEADLSGPGRWEGEISRVHRVEAGAQFDAFETDAQVPEGLEGRCLIIDLGGELVQAHIIERVEPIEGGALIHVTGEPGIEIRGDLIKMIYYPGWGIQRPATFRIADTLGRPEGP